MAASPPVPKGEHKAAHDAGKHQHRHNRHARAGDEFFDFLKHVGPSLVDPEGGASVLTVFRLQVSRDAGHGILERLQLVLS